MTVLAASDLKAVVETAATWQEAGSLSELATIALPRLYELVRCDGVGWNEIDLAGGEVHARVAPSDYDMGPLETLNRLVNQHPLVTQHSETGNTAAVKISDFLTVREFHELELYCDFYRPRGVEDQLAVLIDTRPDRIVGVAFNRGRRTFRERDRVMLDLLRPLLAASYRNIAMRTDAAARVEALERGLEGRAVVVVEHDGRIADLDDRARALLTRFLGDVPVTLEPGVYADEDGEVEVRSVAGDPPLLILDERRFRPDPLRVHELGLTPREAEVLTLVARGHTDSQIATALFVSRRTVAKHLEHVYEKLGVHSRAEAAARLLDR